jgi:hypothetical protein
MQKPERSEARALAVAKAISEPILRAFDGWPHNEPCGWDQLPEGGKDQERMLSIAQVAISAASVAGMPSREEALAKVELALFAERAPTVVHLWEQERAAAFEHEAKYPGYLDGRSLITDVIRDARIAVAALFASPSDGDGNGEKPNPGGANG